MTWQIKFAIVVNRKLVFPTEVENYIFQGENLKEMLSKGSEAMIEN